jgi:hypothetical protein
MPSQYEASYKQVLLHEQCGAVALMTDADQVLSIDVGYECSVCMQNYIPVYLT